SAPARPAPGDHERCRGAAGEDRRHPRGGRAPGEGPDRRPEGRRGGDLPRAGAEQGPAPPRDGADGGRDEDHQVPGAAPGRQDQQGVPGGAARDRDVQVGARRAGREDPGGDGGEREAQRRGARPGREAGAPAARDGRRQGEAGRRDPRPRGENRQPGGGAPPDGGKHRAGGPGAVPESREAAQGARPGRGAGRALRRLPRARHAEADPDGAPGYRPHRLRLLQALPVRSGRLGPLRRGGRRGESTLVTPRPARRRTKTAPSALVAHIDGGARGNPGPAGYGVSIEDGEGRPVADLYGYLGVATNNTAEYAALLALLEYAVAAGAPSLRILSDSELLVRQIKGEYRVKHPSLQVLHGAARRLMSGLPSVVVEHVRREQNRAADALANRAMDLRESSGPLPEVLRDLPPLQFQPRLP